MMKSDGDGTKSRRSPFRKRSHQRPVQPLYRACGTDSVIVCWVGIFANLLLVAWLGWWVVRNYAAIDPGWLQLVAISFLGVFFADWFSGFVHWGMDTWFDEDPLTRLVSIAREHHLYPHHILGYGVRDYVAFSSWPNLVFLGPFAVVLTLLPVSTAVFDGVVVFLIVSAIMVFGTHAHRLGHRRSRSAVVRRLQRWHLLMSPSHHSRHHRAGHDTHYCVVTGWANIVCDYLGVWRFLERCTHRLLGAVPRRNDHEWFARYAAEPDFPPGRRALEAAKARRRME